MGRQKKTKGSKKVVARLDADQWQRADSIREKYGFKSIYEISQYLWGCFLRVADPDNDKEEEPLPDEIQAMFADLSESERHFEYVKPKRNPTQKTVNDMQGQLQIWEE